MDTVLTKMLAMMTFFLLTSVSIKTGAEGKEKKWSPTFSVFSGNAFDIHLFASSAYPDEKVKGYDIKVVLIAAKPRSVFYKSYRLGEKQMFSTLPNGSLHFHISQHFEKNEKYYIEVEPTDSSGGPVTWLYWQTKMFLYKDLPPWGPGLPPPGLVRKYSPNLLKYSGNASDVDLVLRPPYPEGKADGYDIKVFIVGSWRVVFHERFGKGRRLMFSTLSDGGLLFHIPYHFEDDEEYLIEVEPTSSSGARVTSDSWTTGQFLYKSLMPREKKWSPTFSVFSGNASDIHLFASSAYPDEKVKGYDIEVVLIAAKPRSVFYKSYRLGDKQMFSTLPNGSLHFYISQHFNKNEIYCIEVVPTDSSGGPVNLFYWQTETFLYKDLPPWGPVLSSGGLATTRQPTPVAHYVNASDGHQIASLVGPNQSIWGPLLPGAFNKTEELTLMVKLNMRAKLALGAASVICVGVVLKLTLA